MKPVLETLSVTKTYQVDEMVIHAVDHVSTHVNAGEFVALVGPSGSGKTTMLAMLAGLLTPSNGTVAIKGVDIHALSEKDRTRFRSEKIGFTFQSNNLIPYLNVLENVELMLQLKGTFDKPGRLRAKELLERLGLGERLHNLPAQLSGGQQQRVAIARSLIHDPDVVLADEPTASLDTERAYQVVQTFADLIHEQNRAGIMVTHDLRMCRYVDKVIEMKDGMLDRVLIDRHEIDQLAGVMPVAANGHRKVLPRTTAVHFAGAA
jgi:putative ABC transport system ATP-binding protein